MDLDEEAMVTWGQAIGGAAEAPLVIALRGDLGAGKTTLARAIARGAGVRGPVPSPTYNLLFRYPTARGFDLVHVDLYRIEREEDVWQLGWAELPGDDELVLIEWPSRAESRLPVPRWEITLSETDDPETRRVRMAAVGEPGAIPSPGGVL